MESYIADINGSEFTLSHKYASRWLEAKGIRKNIVIGFIKTIINKRLISGAHVMRYYSRYSQFLSEKLRYLLMTLANNGWI